MPPKTFVVFIGPAGSGKSTAVSAYDKWLRDYLGYSAFKVNLDPAAEFIPYEPDFDVRSIVDAHRIAREFGLGPNGALVMSMDIITKRMSEIFNPIISSEQDMVLIDTPGQMDVYLFKDIAYKLIEELKRVSRNTVVLFIVEADTIKRYEDYAFLSIISVAIQSRLGVDVIPVINKVDLTPVEDLIGDVISDVDIVVSKLKGLGVYGDMISEILNTIALYSKATRVPKISAKKMLGIEELHRIIHEVTCACGDLT